MRLVQWDFLGHDLSTFKEDLSYVLGIASVLCWLFAEIPQIKTNYITKSVKSLHFYFLAAWLVGDSLNLLGCFLEPATLQTQLYMAVVYSIGTLILTGQKIYYDYLCPRYLNDKEDPPTKLASSDIEEKLINCEYEHADVGGKLQQPSVPIQVNSPSFYYMSARSFTMSPTPISGSYFSHPRDFHQIPEHIDCHEPSKKPLLDEHNSFSAATPPKTKDLLCVASSTILFLGSINHYFTHRTTNQQHGIVLSAGRRLLQDKYNLPSSVSDVSNSIGSYLGWGMAAAYISGRLPQIFLNNATENDKGVVNPYMFILALSGMEYIASILISSLEWSKIAPNLPWLVDAGLCVLLDICILIQLYVQAGNKRHKR